MFGYLLRLRNELAWVLQQAVTNGTYGHFSLFWREELARTNIFVLSIGGNVLPQETAHLISDR